MAFGVVVLASGAGTLLQSLIDADPSELGDAQLVGVVTDRTTATALDRAKAARLPTAVVPLDGRIERTEWDRRLRDTVATFRPDLIVSAGFMRIVGPEFLDRYAGKMINSHPSLLPSFPGHHAVRDALAYGVRITGATIFVVDEGVDTGRILAQVAVAVDPADDVDSLHERIKVVERKLVIDTVRRYAEEAR